MPALQARAGRDTDADAIADVGARSFAAAYADSTRPEDLQAHIARHFTADSVRDAMAGPAGRYLVAARNGEVIAFARLGDPESAGGLPGKLSVEIRQLYVAPEAQRLGAGRHLLEQALAVAREDGAGALWLSAWEAADWALAFYRSAGFREFGKADFRVGNTLYRDLLLWLPVTP